VRQLHILFALYFYSILMFEEKNKEAEKPTGRPPRRSLGGFLSLASSLAGRFFAATSLS
jgi:hypothetical protein